MVRRRDRVFAILVMWIAVLISMGVVMERMSQPFISMQNHYYYFGSAMAGASSTEAQRLLDEINQLSNDLYWQSQAIGQAQILPYLPLVIAAGAILLAGAALATFFIWRSVIVPPEVVEAITAASAKQKGRAAHPSLASLLEDDGELAGLHDDARRDPAERRQSS